MEPGNYLIEASDANNAPASVTVGLMGGETVAPTLTMVPGGSVGGRVVDRAGTPLAGASVTVQGELPVGSTAPGARPVNTQTSPKGDFTLRRLRPGALRLTARLAGFRESVPAIVFLPLAGRIDGVVLVLDRGLDLAGTVVDRANPSRPLAGLTLAATDVATGTVTAAAAPSAADGHFTIHGLFPGPVLLAVQRPQGAPPWTGERVTLPDEGGDRIVGANPGFTVEGTLGGGAQIVTLERLPDAAGDPRSSAIDRAVADTDGAGHFVLRGVLPGRFVLHARGTDGTCSEAPVEVTDHDVPNVTFRARPRAAVHGVVRDPNGQGIANARVEMASAVLSEAGWRRLGQGEAREALREAAALAQSQHLQTRQALTAVDGSFEAACLEPGPYELTVYLGDRQLDWKDAARQGGPKTPMTITVGPGTVSAQVNLDVRACASTVMGKVADKNGSPKAGAWVMALASAASPGSPARSSLTGSSGDYRLTGLCPGTYRLIAHALDDDSLIMSSEIEAADRGTEDVPLRLERPASLSGTVKSGDAAVETFKFLLRSPEVRAQHFVDAGGSFNQSFLLPGVYDALVASREGYAIETIEFRPGETSKVQFKIAPWSTITGEVTDEKGRPVVDLPVQYLFDLARSKSWPDYERLREARTDRTGRFAFDRLPAEKGRLTFGAPGVERFVTALSKVGPEVSAPQFPRIGIIVTPERGQRIDLGDVVIAGQGERR